jgi:hypothetical protein
MPTAALPPLNADDQVGPRQCGRCRLMFPGDPSLFADAIPDWWLCPACRFELLE